MKGYKCRQDLNPSYIHPKNVGLTIYCKDYKTYTNSNGFKCFEFTDVIYNQYYKVPYVYSECDYNYNYYRLDYSNWRYLTKLDVLKYVQVSESTIETICYSEEIQINAKYEAEYLEEHETSEIKVLDEIKAKNLELQNKSKCRNTNNCMEKYGIFKLRRSS